MNRNELKKRTEGIPVIAKTPEYKLDYFWNTFPIIISLIGINSDVDERAAEIQINTLRKLVFDNFGNHITLEEFKYAVELYALGEIVIDEKDHHYGKFNIKFFSEMLNGYLNLKRNLPPIQNRIDASMQLEGKSEFETLREHYIANLEAIKKESIIHGNLSYWKGLYWRNYIFLFETYRINPDKQEMLLISHVVSGDINTEADQLPTPELRRDYRNKFNQKSELFKNRCRSEYFQQWAEGVLKGEKIDEEISFAKTVELNK